jgi:hypothetical protein
LAGVPPKDALELLRALGWDDDAERIEQERRFKSLKAEMEAWDGSA